MQIKTKKVLSITLVLLTFMMVACVGVISYSKASMDIASEGKVFWNVSDVPESRIALVLGCRRVLADGRENLYFRYRIDASVDLFRSGKVDYIIVSGDNSKIDYDEATEMMRALIEKGIPEKRIVRDYAGFSTLDSVIRMKKVFQSNKFIVVSQEFHVRRAIYIGEAHGIDVTGFAARDVTGRYGLRTKIRESLARVKAILDVQVLRRKPKFLGEPILIGCDQGQVI